MATDNKATSTLPNMAQHLTNKPPPSECQHQGKLYDPRRIGTRELPEGAIAHRRVQEVERRVVGEVEELPSQADRPLLPPSEGLAQGEVPVVDPRTPYRAVSGVSEGEERGGSEGLSVEPLRDRFGAVGIAHNVRPLIESANARLVHGYGYGEWHSRLNRGNSGNLPPTEQRFCDTRTVLEHRQVVRVTQHQHLRDIEAREASLGPEV